MSIYRVIDRLEEYLRESTLLPFRRRIVSEEKVLDLIEKMRATLPEEVGRAKLIAKDKDRMLREAQERAQAIVSEASEHHAQMVDNHEIVQQARTTADVVLKEAEERARAIREGADQYAAVVLADLQNRLSVALASVRKGQETLGVRQTGTGTAAAITEAAAQSKRAAFDSLSPEAQAAEPIENTHLMVETAELEIS
ncbi:MAG: ATPase [Vulcanimicrobiaceae bacterium]